MLLPGLVIRIFDRRIEPAKHKRHICIHPARSLFLRINSSAFWPPSHLLMQDNNRAFVDYDSHVELRQLYRMNPSDLKSAMLHPGNPLGRMSREEAKELAWSARRAETLSDEYRDLIWNQLVTTWVDQ